MSRNEQIATDIWQDAPFCDLTAPAKLVYLWSFCNALCRMSGIYKVRRELIALDTGLTNEAVAAALDELDAQDMVLFDGRHLWCRARVKRLRTGRGPGIARAVARDIAALESQHPFRIAFLDRHADDAWLRDELRPLVAESHQGATERGLGCHPDSRVVEGKAGCHPGPTPVGPLQLHMQGSSRSAEDDSRARAVEDDVWSHYLAVVQAGRPGPRPTFDKQRRNVVREALAVREVEQCKLAIDGLARSSHHRGENDQGTAYLGIRYALRGNGARGESNEERIDRMAALATATPRRAGERPNLTAAQLVAAEKAGR